MLSPSHTVPGSSWPAPPSLYTEHEILWHGILFWQDWVSSFGCAPSCPLVHLPAGRAWETGKSLAQGK